MLNSTSFKCTWVNIVLLAVCGACGSSAKITPQTKQAPSMGTTYINPVFEPILADPTAVKDPKTGLFYAYGTADNWGDGKGTRLVPILESKNLVDWTWVGTAFQQKPTWKAEGGVWAPDVILFKNHYAMYYAYSTWGDPNPGIGVATADSPKGPFTDQGKLFDSKEVNVPNSIDPFFFQEAGENYLFWGSYSDAETQGTYGIMLDEEGLKVPDLDQKFKVAAGDFEAVVIHKRKGYYYFLGSKGSCCDGENSNYHVLVGRSKNLKGPYLDKQGRDLAERGNGTMLLKGNDTFVGTGHNSRIFKDERGQDWMLYHGIDPKHPRVSTGANRRVLMLDKITWINDWPAIDQSTSSRTEQSAPAFD